MRHKLYISEEILNFLDDLTREIFGLFEEQEAYLNWNDSKTIGDIRISSGFQQFNNTVNMRFSCCVM
jgi:hypothetical protein